MLSEINALFYILIHETHSSSTWQSNAYALKKIIVHIDLWMKNVVPLLNEWFSK
jgi:hypothetical protein